MIRPYRPSDLDALLDIWTRASALAHPFLSAEFMEQERRAIPELHLPVADTWVWEADGRVAGFMALLGNEVGALFVDPALHRSGIGRELVAKARALHGDLEVEVFEKNVIGRAFYAKVGFRQFARSMHEPAGFEVLRLRLPGEPAAPPREHGSSGR